MWGKLGLCLVGAFDSAGLTLTRTRLQGAQAVLEMVQSLSVRDAGELALLEAFEPIDQDRGQRLVGDAVVILGTRDRAVLESEVYSERTLSAVAVASGEANNVVAVARAALRIALSRGDGDRLVKAVGFVKGDDSILAHVL